MNTPNSGFTPGTPVFAHYISARRWYAPSDLAKVNNSEIERVTEMDKRKKKILSNHQKPDHCIVFEWAHGTTVKIILNISYSGDLKSDHTKSGNIQNSDFLKVGFQIVGL